MFDETIKLYAAAHDEDEDVDADDDALNQGFDDEDEDDEEEEVTTSSVISANGLVSFSSSAAHCAVLPAYPAVPSL